jgi:hypothetical protein
MGEIKAKTQLEKLGFSDPDKKKSKHDIIQKWVCDNVDKIISETVMAKNPHPYTITETKWEHPVIYENGNYKMLVGYIDVMVHIKGDFFYKDTDTYESSERFVFIEVKTEIPVLGELIRQMRAYQSYNNKRTSYMVISPDDRHIETLRQQGFWFYKYNDPTKLF